MYTFQYVTISHTLLSVYLVTTIVKIIIIIMMTSSFSSNHTNITST